MFMKLGSNFAKWVVKRKSGQKFGNRFDYCILNEQFPHFYVMLFQLLAMQLVHKYFFL